VILAILLLCPKIFADELVFDTFTEDFGGPKPGFRYKVRNLSIEGTGNVFKAESGSEVEIEMEVLHDCISCGNAINQIIVGLSSDDKAQVSVWNGKNRSGGGVKIVNAGTKVECFVEDNSGEAEWVKVTFSLKISEKPGIYYIRSRYSQAYTGNLLTEVGRKSPPKKYNEPLWWWKRDRPNGPDKSSNIGKVIVAEFSKVSQLPIVKATGGQGTEINWAEEKAQENADENGPGFFYNDCAQRLRSINASSVLAPQGSKDYSIKNLTDDDPMTAWIEGVKGFGLGEWFEVEGITVNVIYNGYQSSPKNWLSNSRVKRFKVFVDNEPVCFLDLTDEMSFQRFELPHEVNWDERHTFRFQIEEVYRGTKWDDVCISHIDHYACCIAGDSDILLRDNKQIPVSELFQNAMIVSFLEDKNISQISEIQKVYKQTHIELLEIHAGGHMLRITPAHPLYFKGKGFTSLQSIKYSEGHKIWQELENTYEVLTYAIEEKEFKYHLVKKIKILSGSFDTFTIKNYGENLSYIANGFVTRHE